ncbi:MAG TPA: hypothetical protein VFN89_05485 [Solirubrobacterales bacterium]|nr:hypothetical protein [Solirubrobacterales bacterium]
MTAASIFSDFWNDQIIANEKQGLFLVLVGFILSFAFIRMSTRLMRSPRVPWWPGSVVSEGGVHVHHLVFGIVTMMISGTLGLAALGESPYAEICAFLFGVGAGLTIDEFALWVYLDDVYWAEEGRASIDATVIAAAGMMLILLGFSPFSFDTSSFEQTIASILGAVFVFALVAICFLKKRVLHGSIGFFVFPLAAYGAARIGKPDSAWARRRYAARNPGKQATAVERFKPDRHTERFKNAFRDMIGGKPSEGLAAASEEALATTREAVEEVRQGVERVTRPGGGKNDA